MVKPSRRGYVLIILLVAILALSIGLTVAIPDLRTELLREREEELIFRGRQYVEAVRIFQIKNPGKFPASLKELGEKKFIRRLYKEPMTQAGNWNVILSPGPARQGRSGQSGQEILVAPESALETLSNPIVLGVVSPSTEKSIRMYEDQDSYDKWLFYLGHDPKTQPKIIYVGRKEGEKD
jgi:hypothetical protein